MIDSTFKTCKSKGDIGEFRVLDWAHHHRHRVTDHSEGNVPSHDIILFDGDVQMIIEVKTCTLDSPNVAVELSSYGQPSGIHSTKANYFFIVSLHDNKIYAAKTNDLIEYIELKEPKTRYNKTNNSMTKIALIPKTDWEQKFYSIDCSNIPDYHDMPPRYNVIRPHPEKVWNGYI